MGIKIYLKSGFLLLIAIVLIAFIFYQNYYFSDLNWLFRINKNHDSSSNFRCRPFNNITSSSQVEIDNETYPKFTPLYNNPEINYTCLNENKSKKLILFWTTWFGRTHFDYGLGFGKPFENHNCPVTNCELTNDRARLNESDLIVFHMRDSIKELPSYREENQRWIFYLYESPKHSGNFRKYNGLFNLSATYKQSSNFTSGYFINFTWVEKNEDFNEKKDYTVNKTEFAAIVVSNCHDNSKRLQYVKELQKTIPVTIFGACGKKKCPKSTANDTRGDCKKLISKKFKFYFSFENSICNDYVTEKFFYVLQFDIIPVVYGGGDYNKYVPKSGYINAFDFATPKQLAEYLIYLDGNSTAYNSYFKWKKHIKFNKKRAYKAQLCEMCILLNLESYVGIKRSVIRDMNEFWNVRKDCKRIDEKTFKLI